jgi:hypothetical protein
VLRRPDTNIPNKRWNTRIKLSGLRRTSGASDSDSRITLQKYANVIGDAQRRAVDSLAGRVSCNSLKNNEDLVGAVGIEIASLQNKSCTVNGIVPPPTFNCCLLSTLAHAQLHETRV